MTKNVIEVRGDNVKIRVLVGGRLATTFWSKNDQETIMRIPELMKRFCKRNRKAVATTRKAQHLGRIVEVCFDYTDEKDPKPKSTALVPLSKKVEALRAARRVPVCPVARPSQ